MCASNQNGTAKNATWITLRVYATFHPLFSTNHPMAYKRNVRKTAFASKLRNSSAASSSAEVAVRKQMKPRKQHWKIRAAPISALAFCLKKSRNGSSCLSSPTSCCSEYRSGAMTKSRWRVQYRVC